MRRIIFSLFTIGILLTCCKDDDKFVINEQNYLIFGHFYGMCMGDNCIVYYKLTNNALYKDITKDRSGQNLEFVKLGNDLFEQVKDLADSFPNKLLNHNETFLGCPDCADGGGLFIQYSENGNAKSWKIDQIKENVPSYLHHFIDKVNEKIKLLNN